MKHVGVGLHRHLIVLYAEILWGRDGRSVASPICRSLCPWCASRTSPFGPRMSAKYFRMSATFCGLGAPMFSTGPTSHKPGGAM